MKRIIIVLLSVMSYLSGIGQNWQWENNVRTNSFVTGYHTNDIKMDSEGNVYVSQTVQGRTCAFDQIKVSVKGVDMWPSHLGRRGEYQHDQFPVGGRSVDLTSLYKLSPDGELLWHGSFTSNTALNPGLFTSLHLVGDTELVAFMYWVPDYGRWNYFWDTTYTGMGINELYPNMKDSLYALPSLAVLTFDLLDGHIKEKHFLHLGFVDSTGHVLQRRDVDPDYPHEKDSNCYCLSTIPLQTTPTAIDCSGNIYIRGEACLTFDRRDFPRDVTQYVGDGLVAGYAIIVDGHTRFKVYPDMAMPQGWSVALFKFSPHFENLLGFTPAICGQYGDYSEPRAMVVDSMQNVYIGTTYDMSGYTSPYDSIEWQVPGNPDLVFHLYRGQDGFGVGGIIRYDSLLHPVWLKQVMFEQDSDYHSETESPSKSTGCFSLAIDEASNSLFAAMQICTGPIGSHYDGGATMDGHHIRTNNMAAGVVLRFDKTTGELQRYGIMGRANDQILGNMSIGGGRIFIPMINTGYFEFGDFFWDGRPEWEVITVQRNGLGIWDYNCNPLVYYDIGAVFTQNVPMPKIVHHGERVYLSHLLSGALRISDTIYNNLLPGDQVFASVYGVWPNENPVAFDTTSSWAGIPAVVPQYQELKIYPNPATGLVTMDLPWGETITTCSLVTMQGLRLPVTVSGHTLDISMYPSGVYLLDLATPTTHYRTRVIKINP